MNKRPPSFRTDSVHGGCVIGLKRADDASTILRKKVIMKLLARHFFVRWGFTYGLSVFSSSRGLVEAV